MKKFALNCLFVLFAVVCAFEVSNRATAQESKPSKMDPEKIRGHVKFLSDDALEGRGTGQKGGDEAADYIAAQFKSYGLKPASDKGTYFQDVQMVEVKTLPETTFTLIPATGLPVPLKNLDDFVTNNESQSESADIDAPIVFLGYGIRAPEYNWDDYKDVDLRGKVALLFVNEPTADDPNFFKGKALTYYGRWTYKFEETARRGAVATLIIHRKDLASYGWDVVRNSWGTQRSYLQRDSTPKLQAASWIQQEVAKKLVGMAGLDLDKLFQQSQSREFKAIELSVHLKAHVASQLRPFISRNVLAMLEGSDPGKKGEAVLYTAHYDHLGIDPAKSGDNIYNGAVDNATGCGILLELARVWAKAKKAPPRSILFASVTAEEQGLLGSEYMGKKSAYLPVDPILDLNFDALQPIGIPEDAEVSGAERTTFYPVVESTAKKFGLAIQPDASPEAGHYYRSDHFSLARVGIPSFSISQGTKFAGHDRAWGEAQAKDYVNNRYHQPADEYRADWDFRGLAKIASFGYALGLEAATQPALIHWQPGDEFEPAGKKRQSRDIDGDTLFAGRPDLRFARPAHIYYPPLARQTGTAGTILLRVAVAAGGTVSKADALKGHPLLSAGPTQVVKEWMFTPQPGEARSFELKCEFVMIGPAANVQRTVIAVSEPFHLLLMASPPMVEPQTSR
jgi:Zn-dependent M28 family amino/carboxypeptidase